MTDFRMNKSKPIGRKTISTIAGFNVPGKPKKKPVPTKVVEKKFEVVKPLYEVSSEIVLEADGLPGDLIEALSDEDIVWGPEADDGVLPEEPRGKGPYSDSVIDGDETEKILMEEEGIIYRVGVDVAEEVSREEVDEETDIDEEDITTEPIEEDTEEEEPEEEEETDTEEEPINEDEDV